MTTQITLLRPSETSSDALSLDGIQTPALIASAGDRAVRRFLEFFTAEIRNPNTRAAYAQGITEFLAWCDGRGLQLDLVEPIIVAAYVEQLGKERSAPTVKQHLAAVRMLFDYLVIGQVIPTNPAAAVKGPKHVTSTGKTPVLFQEEARRLLDSIDISELAGLRDRAILGVMTFSFARVGAVVRMLVKHFYIQGPKAYFVLHEKGSKYHRVPAHHPAAEYVDEYLQASGIASDREGALFRTIGGQRRLLSDRPLSRVDVFRMIKRRARDAEFPPEICCHTFRATGITNYLENGGNLETAAKIAGHSSTRTTQLYDRTRDEITLDEIERIRI